MHKLKILNTRDIKKIKDYLKEHYGAKEDLKEFAFLQNEKGKLFLITKDYAKVKDHGLRINRTGLYFGKEERNEIRLSIEGAQMIKATKNIVQIKDAKKYIQGYDVETKDKAEGYAIVKEGKDILGCGKYKEGMVLNFTPKERRIAKD